MRNSVSEGQLEDRYDGAGFDELVENYLKSYIRERILSFSSFRTDGFAGSCRLIKLVYDSLPIQLVNYLPTSRMRS